MASLVGSRVERKEDKRFLTGKGRYTADINLANQTYAIFISAVYRPLPVKNLLSSFLSTLDPTRLAIFISPFYIFEAASLTAATIF